MIWGGYMDFRSTRGAEVGIKSSEAIIKGIAKDGGLFVPDSFKNIYNSLVSKRKASYEEITFSIIKEFFTDIKEENLKYAINNAYKDRFDAKVENEFLELYHGPTCAFKDAALLFLPQIMKEAKRVCKVSEEIVILTATSGDTGKAALSGFKDVEGVKVVVYYPEDGVSEIQKKQMITQEGKNLKVIAIKGNFDNAQKGVKDIFNDSKFKEELKNKGYILSSANSINIGRLIPQIVYYFYGYLNLINNGKIEEGDEINVAVPTGNFGNILAAYYAKKMGLPIHKFICASNENNVLTDFFKTGIYNKKRELILTESPSMDILVSSNLERLLYEACGRDPEEVSRLMNNLSEKGIYKINDKMREFLNDFYGDFSTKEEVYESIKKEFSEKNYLMDTHTAVAYSVYNKYKDKTNDKRQVLIASTASPYKFPRSICNALEMNIEDMDDFEVLNKLSKETNTKIPNCLLELKNKDIRHKEVCNKEDMKKAILSYLEGNKNYD